MHESLQGQKRKKGSKKRLLVKLNGSSPGHVFLPEPAVPPGCTVNSNSRLASESEHFTIRPLNKRCPISLLPSLPLFCLCIHGCIIFSHIHNDCERTCRPDTSEGGLIIIKEGEVPAGLHLICCLSALHALMIKCPLVVHISHVHHRLHSLNSLLQHLWICYCLLYLLTFISEQVPIFKTYFIPATEDSTRMQQHEMYFLKQLFALLEQFHVFNPQMNCCQLFVDPNQKDTFVLKLSDGLIFI